MAKTRATLDRGGRSRRGRSDGRGSGLCGGGGRRCHPRFCRSRAGRLWRWPGARRTCPFSLRQIGRRRGNLPRCLALIRGRRRCRCPWHAGCRASRRTGRPSSRRRNLDGFQIDGRMRSLASSGVGRAGITRFAWATLLVRHRGSILRKNSVRDPSTPVARLGHRRVRAPGQVGALGMSGEVYDILRVNRQCAGMRGTPGACDRAGTSVAGGDLARPANSDRSVLSGRAGSGPRSPWQFGCQSSRSPATRSTRASMPSSVGSAAVSSGTEHNPESRSATASEMHR